MASINVAAQANGGVATASSEYSSVYYAIYANDGYRITIPSSWWNSYTGILPEWLQIDFDAAYDIGEVDAIFQRDDHGTNSSPPTLSETWTLEGVTDFQIQYWNGSSWQDFTGCNVTGNDKVWRQFTFSPVNTDKIRIYITAAPGGYGRVVELEAWTAEAGTTSASIAATDSPDTASLNATNWRTAQLAASDSSDTASLSASATVGASIAATDSPDSAAFSAVGITTAQIAANDSPDTAALNATNWATAQIAATDSPDTASLSGTATVGASISASDSPDTAALTGVGNAAVTTALIAATESPDTAALTAQTTLGASLAATESPDTAAFSATSLTTAQIAATESSDTAALVASATTGATIAAQESSDFAAFMTLITASATIAASDSPDHASIHATNVSPTADVPAHLCIDVRQPGRVVVDAFVTECVETV